MHKIKRTGEILLNITERDDPHHIDNIDHSDTKNGKVESGLPLSGIGNDKAEKKADRSDPVAAIHDLHSGCSRNTENPSAQEEIGRASCRESGKSSGVSALQVKKNNNET